jgi:hypothetical protein
MSTTKEQAPREFLCTRDDKSVVRISVRIPGKAEIEAGDMEYSAQFNNAILHKLPTQTALLRRLRENGIIEPAVEEEIGQLSQELRVLQKQVRDDKFKSEEDRSKAKAELATKSKRIGDLNRDIESFFEHTADIKAAQAQRNFMIACVTEYVDGPKKGERVWESVDDLMSETDGGLLNRCIYEYVTLANGQDSDWENLIKGATTTDDKKPDAEPDATAAIAAATEGVVEAPVELSTMNFTGAETEAAPVAAAAPEAAPEVILIEQK